MPQRHSPVAQALVPAIQGVGWSRRGHGVSLAQNQVCRLCHSLMPVRPREAATLKAPVRHSSAHFDVPPLAWMKPAARL